MATEGFGFEITELRLGLPGGSSITASTNNEKKRVFSEVEKVEDFNSSHGGGDDGRRLKQVVGWPPVCSYRRRNSFKEKEECESEGNIMGKKIKTYVKVSFDGAPFLRKVDLGMVKGYGDLVGAMEKLFGSPIGCSEFTLTYEDRDGDWMLVGDVPWKMFTESCKRLRIMKKTEAKRSETTSSLSQ